MKILIIDNHQSNLQLISTDLNNMGHDVLPATNCEAAYQMFVTEHPDLVIIDFPLPETTGFDCVKKIREYKNENKDWVPIIFLSDEIDEKNIVKGIEAGADDFLTRPTSKVALEAKVKAMQRLAVMRSKLLHTTKKLSILSKTDPLTGIPNRLELDSILKKKIAYANSEKNILALIMLDVDNFKSINDSLGHHAGDLVLKEIALRLSLCVRKRDFIARLGGDEFAMILSDLNTIHDAEKIANKITRVLAPEYTLEEQSLNVHLSFGIACYPFAGADKKTLMLNADQAMYKAKSQGGNTYQFYTEELDKKNKLEYFIEAMLKTALERHEFQMVYQPIYNLHTDEIIAYEASLQWQHPEKDLISPNIFIPIAEETDLINQIGKWMFQQVCEDSQKWQADFKRCKVVINILSMQLLTPGFANTIQEIMHKTNVNPATVGIELTESFIMLNTLFSEKFIRVIHNMGMEISVSDVGIGYSSLLHLKQLPISAIKINESLIRDLLVDANDATIVSALIMLGKNLNINVIAAGIETAEQKTFLIKHDCPEGQGAYLSKPFKLTQRP